MQVTLSDRTSNDIADFIASGDYATAEEVIAAAIRALQDAGSGLAEPITDEAYWAEIRASLEESEEDFREGRCFEFTPQWRENWLRQVEERERERERNR